MPAKKGSPARPSAAPGQGQPTEEFEKLGVFYLGRPYALEAKQARPGWLLYDSKDLVTHAVCVGMTGSGKTGLCVGLLEEAAIDGIPAIVIDRDRLVRFQHDVAVRTNVSNLASDVEGQCFARL